MENLTPEKKVSQHWEALGDLAKLDTFDDTITDLYTSEGKISYEPEHLEIISYHRPTKVLVNSHFREPKLYMYGGDLRMEDIPTMFRAFNFTRSEIIELAKLLADSGTLDTLRDQLPFPHNRRVYLRAKIANYNSVKAVVVKHLFSNLDDKRSKMTALIITTALNDLDMIAKQRPSLEIYRQQTEFTTKDDLKRSYWQSHLSTLQPIDTSGITLSANTNRDTFWSQFEIAIQRFVNQVRLLKDYEAYFDQSLSWFKLYLTNQMERAPESIRRSEVFEKWTENYSLIKMALDERIVLTVTDSYHAKIVLDRSDEIFESLKDIEVMGISSMLEDVYQVRDTRADGFITNQRIFLAYQTSHTPNVHEKMFEDRGVKLARRPHVEELIGKYVGDLAPPLSRGNFAALRNLILDSRSSSNIQTIAVPSEEYVELLAVSSSPSIAIVANEPAEGAEEEKEVEPLEEGEPEISRLLMNQAQDPAEKDMFVDYSFAYVFEVPPEIRVNAVTWKEVTGRVATRNPLVPIYLSPDRGGSGLIRLDTPDWPQITALAVVDDSQLTADNFYSTESIPQLLDSVSTSFNIPELKTTGKAVFNIPSSLNRLLFRLYEDAFITRVRHQGMVLVAAVRLAILEHLNHEQGLGKLQPHEKSEPKMIKEIKERYENAKFNMTPMIASEIIRNVVKSVEGSALGELIMPLVLATSSSPTLGFKTLSTVHIPAHEQRYVRAAAACHLYLVGLRLSCVIDTKGVSLLSSYFQACFDLLEAHTLEV